MSKQSIEKDFLAARSKAATTVMNATGWKPGFLDPQNIGVDSVFFYVLDHKTRWMWSCSIPLDAFLTVVQSAKGEKAVDSIGCCSHMITHCAAAKGLTPEQENDLAISLSAYIAITKCFELTESASKANHFVVIRYGATDTLRPFAMNGSKRYLCDVKEVQSAMAQVVSMDTEKHPDWIA